MTRHSKNNSRLATCQQPRFCFFYFSNIKLHWNRDVMFHCAFISSIMPSLRFLQILYNSHLTDDSSAPKRDSKNYNKIYKTKRFTEILRRNFQKNYNFGPYGTIDESMIKFKGSSCLKQYLPPKPIKRGYKVWRLCDSVTGYLFNYQIYSVEEEIDEKRIPLGERVVFDFISCHNFQEKHLYFDKCFTSLGLLEKLKLQNITVSGTIEQDRANIPSSSIKKDKMKCANSKSEVMWHSIVFVRMNTKHGFLASTYLEDNEFVLISRRLKNG